MKSVTANAVVRKFTYEARQGENDGYTRTLRCFYCAKVSNFCVHTIYSLNSVCVKCFYVKNFIIHTGIDYVYHYCGRAVFAKPKVVVLYKLNCKHPAASAKMSVSSADSGLY